MRWIIGSLLSTAVGLCQQPGQPLPAWSAGTLDIHQIHTGRGNAALIVFPDGTIALLDAGDVPDRPGVELGPQRPNQSRTPAEWIVRYIRQFSGRDPASLDYAIVTHYHDDHIGALPSVAAAIPIRVLLDRGTDPAPPDYEVVRRYMEFRRTFRGKIEVLQPGRKDQIAARYPRLEVRNVAANGTVWTGRGDTAGTRFPKAWKSLPAALRPTENHFSLALRIRYGRFDYFTGGDLPGIPLDDAPDWHDMETPVARAIGAVDVAVLNHHGWLDTTNQFFLRTLQPRVVVIPAWHASHPDHSVMRRLRSPDWKPAPPDLFITSLLDAPRAVFSYLAGSSFQSTEGHIVVRVAPGGERYTVIILDDTQESPVVKSVHGPYDTR
jgi:beta-lactamase superfamily II metal-dependent hydrolase